MLALFLSEEGTSFVNARARIAYMESWVTGESAIDRIETIIDRNNNLYAVVLVATLALSSILGYYFICKRKS